MTTSARTAAACGCRLVAIRCPVMRIITSLHLMALLVYRAALSPRPSFSGHPNAGIPDPDQQQLEPDQLRRGNQPRCKPRGTADAAGIPCKAHHPSGRLCTTSITCHHDLQIPQPLPTLLTRPPLWACAFPFDVRQPFPGPIPSPSRCPCCLEVTLSHLCILHISPLPAYAVGASNEYSSSVCTLIASLMAFLMRHFTHAGRGPAEKLEEGGSDSRRLPAREAEQ